MATFNFNNSPVQNSQMADVIVGNIEAAHGINMAAVASSLEAAGVSASTIEEIRRHVAEAAARPSERPTIGARLKSILASLGEGVRTVPGAVELARLADLLMKSAG